MRGQSDPTGWNTFSGMPKTYHAAVVLGARSDTDDADGTIVATASLVPPTLEQIRQQLASFVGTIMQVPPAYSAAKVTGRRAYAMARRGEEVSLAARSVTIHAIDLVSYAFPVLELELIAEKALTSVRWHAILASGSAAAATFKPCAEHASVASMCPPPSRSTPTQTRRSGSTSAGARRLGLPQQTVADADVIRLCQGQALRFGAVDPAAGEVALLDERAA